MSELNEKLKGIMKRRKDKTQRRAPSSLRTTITAKELEEAEIDKLTKAFFETKTSERSMNTGKGRKKTRKKKGKKRNTRKRYKNHK